MGRRIMKRFPWLLALTLTALVLLPATSASACPMCKAALANSQGGGDLVSGFFWSILFMMAMPFTILGSFSGYMYWQVRRARASRADCSPPGQSDGAAPHVE
jgi:hypothetical protein